MIVEHLMKQTGLSAAQLENYAATASRRYKVYPIPKRGGGTRQIAQPSKEIKAIQRWLVRAVFRFFPIHSAATAYKRGAGIRENALRHAGTSFTLRLDFKDFFPSFSERHVQAFLQQMNDDAILGLSVADVVFATKIVTRNGEVSIGAPSSPLLTNAMMYAFDVRLSNWASSERFVYTRYADDIFLSSSEPGRLSFAIPVVERICREHLYGDLRLNREKTAFLSKRYRRAITGLVVTPGHKISIGRERKREVKTLVYLFGANQLDPEREAYLRGMLAFISDVEPDFRWALIKKYGAATLAELEGRGEATGS